MTAPSNLGISPGDHEPVPDPIPVPLYAKKTWPIDLRDDVYLAQAALGINHDANHAVDIIGRPDAKKSVLSDLLDPDALVAPSIESLTPPVPSSTREWLLMKLAERLETPNGIKSVGAPVGLESSASLEAVISKVNSIISALIEAGVFSRDQNPVVK